MAKQYILRDEQQNFNVILEWNIIKAKKKKRCGARSKAKATNLPEDVTQWRKEAAILKKKKKSSKERSLEQIYHKIRLHNQPF